MNLEAVLYASLLVVLKATEKIIKINKMSRDT